MCVCLHPCAGQCPHGDVGCYLSGVVEALQTLSPLTLIKLGGPSNLEDIAPAALYTGSFVRSGLMAKLLF